MAHSSLISTAELAELMNQSDGAHLRIIDATAYLPAHGRNAEREFAESRIPGSVRYNVDAVIDPARPALKMLPTSRQFEDAVSELGIGNHHRIVIYDRHGLYSAARAWFTFRLFGHENVAILDGGLPKWQYENRPVERALPRQRAAERFFARESRSKQVANLERVRTALSDGTEVVVDVRSTGRFRGAEEEVEPFLRRGHMPGAINVPFRSLLEADHTVKPPEQIEKLLHASGARADLPVIATCGGGTTACILLLALQLIGRSDVALYDGSWREWGARNDTPVERDP